jgi:hypothetical protein
VGKSAQNWSASALRAGFFFAAAAIFPGDPLRSQSDRSLALPMLAKPKVMTIDSKPMMQFLAIGQPCQLNVNQIRSLQFPPCLPQPTSSGNSPFAPTLFAYSGLLPATHHTI